MWACPAGKPPGPLPGDRDGARSGLEAPCERQDLPPGPNNPLGSRWIGFHRDCAGKRGFNGQQHLEVKGCVSAGFHGTPQRESIGQAVSHGCVRMYDENVRDLFELVRMGMVVTVLP